MLSRRNIRIKILQALYMMGRDLTVDSEGALDFYRERLEDSRDLYLFNLFNLIRTTEFAVEHTERKSAKYLPSEEDKKFSAKLFENASIQALVREQDLQETFVKKDLVSLVEEDNLRKYYKGFAKTDEYRKYILNDKGDAGDRKILLELYKYLNKEDLYTETMDDHFPTWEDDKSLIVGAMKKTIKSLPDTPEIYRTFRPDYEASVEFGENLLSIVATEGETFEELIEPALENWDMDRVANIDMIFLKMALCEFLHFPTIPTKVTLNEYVELAKLYSTDKSKEFVNGILDKLLTDLQEKKRIQKTGRGLDE